MKLWKLDDEEEPKPVTVINQNKNNNYHLVSDSKFKSNNEENLFDEDVNIEVEATPSPLSIQKWYN